MFDAFILAMRNDIYLLHIYFLSAYASALCKASLIRLWSDNKILVIYFCLDCCEILVTSCPVCIRQTRDLYFSIFIRNKTMSAIQNYEICKYTILHIYNC